MPLNVDNDNREQNFQSLCSFIKERNTSQNSMEEHISLLTRMLAEDPKMLDMRDGLSGMKPLQLAITCDAALQKIAMLLSIEHGRAAKQHSKQGRDMVTIALEQSNVRPEVVGALLGCDEQAVRRRDNEGRFPLHSLLCVKHITAALPPLVKRVAELFPAATKVEFQGTYPLHTAINIRLNSSVISSLLSLNR